MVIPKYHVPTAQTSMDDWCYRQIARVAREYGDPMQTSSWPSADLADMCSTVGVLFAKCYGDLGRLEMLTRVPRAFFEMIMSSPEFAAHTSNMGAAKARASMLVAAAESVIVEEVSRPVMDEEGARWRASLAVRLLDIDVRRAEIERSGTADRRAELELQKIKERSQLKIDARLKEIAAMKAPADTAPKEKTWTIGRSE